ncbi:hypothetical protein CANTEDRAFT_119595 [Yamadazyma tenuis ATCC 10573]|uniref:HECT-type E3 ubiquitin transferase n=1 Tax=Candida tenuis (strain ATCC 10573 / BCRC 21748 / CBS 615 / JCM 9827 / NBRC 10315 / NRRL Y-1498 / VKM Y-70) TaxID=590646 RepID=G3B076_CANTC|nr:uncharacterized protein CANTEDRAFT_119595 [Yamadazyma tenuis ATCC 10573]EGV65338.1 hypothetical protein CANTEDRAFT_119595 [Yamadazyma tenuis ATCC 10573]
MSQEEQDYEGAQTSSQNDDAYEEDEEGDEEDDYQEEYDFGEDEDEAQAVRFLGSLARASQSGNTGTQEQADDNDNDEDEGDGDEDSGTDSGYPRADLLRALGSFSNIRGGGSGTQSSFADVIQRLVGEGFVSPYGGQNNEIDTLINGLGQRDDPFILSESLNQLGEKLLMMNAITAERVIPASKLTRSIISIMNDPFLSDQLELQLVACRCLYNLMEVNLDFIHDVVNNEGIEAVCIKLNEITFIDLTEQALQTLEMISRDPISHNLIISNNGLRACMQYLDFLTIHSQRKCLLIVANVCTNISANNFDKINEVFDNISGVVKNHTDPNVIEHAWLSISRIISSFKSHPSKLETLFVTRVDLLIEVVATIVVSSNKSSVSDSNDSHKVPVSFSSCLSLVKSLIVLASTSVKISAILFRDVSIGECVVKAINKFSKNKEDLKNRGLSVISSSSFKDNISIEAIMAAPNELLSQFLTLIGYLLPINYGPQETPFLKNSHLEFEEKIEINQQRTQICRDTMPEAFWKFVNDIWSFLINSFQALMDFEVRRRILINLFRIVKFMQPDDFKKINGIEMVSALLASIVNQNKFTILKDFNNSVPASQQDTEMKTSDDEDSDESEDENVNDPNAGSKNQDNTAKLNANTLVWSSCLIVLNLIKIEPQIFIDSFEKEGLIKDISTIANHLKFISTSDPINDDYEASRPFLSMYSYKYADIEFSKDYEYKLTSMKIYSKLFHILMAIDELYVNSKEGSIAQVSSVAVEVSNEIEGLLKAQDLSRFPFSKWQESWEKFQLLLDNGSQSVSSFELVSSGIIQALNDVFKIDALGSQDSLCYISFISVFFRRNSQGNALISILVDKLQEALSRVESFEVISAGTSNQGLNLRFSSSNYYDSSQTAGMAKQIKLKLGTDPSDTSSASQLPPTMQNMVLSVHAIASFASVSTFLTQRINFFEALTGSRRNRLNNESNKTGKQTHIEFLINDEVIPNGTTIYGAIYRSLQSEPDEIVESSRIWNSVHQVSFRVVDTPVESPTNDLILYNSNKSYNELKSYDATTINILNLLKVLFEVNVYAQTLKYEPLSIEKFMSWKLTVKLNRQLEEPLIVASGTLPGWAIHVTRQYPFIFPLDTRIFFLQSTSFGYSRLIHQWQIRSNQENENINGHGSQSQRPQLGRPLRHKVRISRKLILQSALKVLNLYGTSPGVLEIEYFDEVGSGLGPTLEFYSSVSKEFSKRKLRLWRDDDPDGDEEDFVDYKTGLFPSPIDMNEIQTENGKKKLYFFRMLGKFIARTLLDSRIIDFRFNPLFLKLVQIFNEHSMNKEGFSDLKKINNLNSLRIVDPSLADSLEHLMKYVELYKNVPEHERDSILVDNCTLEDLSLSFSLPGYPSYQLIADGDNIAITSKNIESYISKVIEATLCNGIIPQTKAFMNGFSKVFPISSLIVFSPNELVNLFGNAVEDWSLETLHSSINANHGYSKDSDAVRTLIDILVHFNDIERRSFLQFLTGAPKLPVGGFKALKPEFTVVRKYPEGGSKDDDYLPSVMTCANYLKLPNYSTEEIMKRKILQAISEGAGAFLLS